VFSPEIQRASHVTKYLRFNGALFMLGSKSGLERRVCVFVSLQYAGGALEEIEFSLIFSFN